MTCNAANTGAVQTANQFDSYAALPGGPGASHGRARQDLVYNMICDLAPFLDANQPGNYYQCTGRATTCGGKHPSRTRLCNCN